MKTARPQGLIFFADLTQNMGLTSLPYVYIYKYIYCLVVPSGSAEIMTMMGSNIRSCLLGLG